MGFNHTIRKRLVQEKRDRVQALIARAKLPRPPRRLFLSCVPEVTVIEPFTPSVLVSVMGQPVKEIP